MKPTNQDVQIWHGVNIVTADNRRLVANRGGYQSNAKGENAHDENIANAELIATAWNALRELNPADPLAAAKALPDVVAALESLIGEAREVVGILGGYERYHAKERGMPGESAAIFQKGIDKAAEALAALKGETNEQSN